MLASGQQLQILQPIIEAVIIAVMHDLMAVKTAPEMLLHHKSMFEDLSTVVHHYPIPGLRDHPALRSGVRFPPLRFGSPPHHFGVLFVTFVWHRSIACQVF